MEAIQPIFVTTTTNVSAGGNDRIAVDATSGNLTVTLLGATKALNFHVWIKKTDVSANTVTISDVDSNTIDGAASVVLSAQYEAVDLVSDGSQWLIM